MNVKETKELLEFGSLLTKKALEAKEKGLKGALSELDKLVELFPAAVAAVKGIDLVDDELKDLDADELGELLGVIAKHFPGLDNDKYASAAKDLLGLVKHGYSLFKTFKG